MDAGGKVERIMLFRAQSPVVPLPAGAETSAAPWPGNGYGCISGTSMASPHAAGVAALIVSKFGTLGGDGDVRLAPGRVADILAGTAVDIGLAGYDECFGNGRVYALRAVTNDTASLFDATAPNCPEYTE